MELKLYYTAVTRCRAKLFLVELQGLTWEKLKNLYKGRDEEDQHGQGCVRPALVEETQLLPRQVRGCEEAWGVGAGEFQRMENGGTHSRLRLYPTRCSRTSGERVVSTTFKPLTPKTEFRYVGAGSLKYHSAIIFLPRKLDMTTLT